MTEPDWSVLPDHLPAPVGRLLRRCLTKDPKQRLQAIGEARIAIEQIVDGTPEVGAVREPPLQPVWSRALSWGIATVILALALFSTLLWVTLRPAPRPATRPIARFVVTLPPTDRLAVGNTSVVAMSPDGLRLVYVANRGGARQLYVRPIDRFEATLIPGTEGAQSPFFSPDGQSVGFFAEGKLKQSPSAAERPGPFAAPLAAVARVGVPTAPLFLHPS